MPSGGTSDLFDEEFADLCSHLAHLPDQVTLPHLVVDRSRMRLRLLDTESSRGGVAIHLGCLRAHASRRHCSQKQRDTCGDEGRVRLR